MTKMKNEKLIRNTFTHPDNKGKSLREIARILDMNPGTLHHNLVSLNLIVPPPPREPRKRSQLNRVPDPGCQFRKPPGRWHPFMARLWYELKMWEWPEFQKKSESAGREGHIVHVSGIRIGWRISAVTRLNGNTSTGQKTPR
jgi:hypothetical protein